MSIDKFNQGKMRSLRLMLLTAEEINDIGKEELSKLDFKTPVTFRNERFMLEEVKNFVERGYKSVDGIDYDQKIEELGPIDSLNKYNMKTAYLL